MSRWGEIYVVYYGFTKIDEHGAWRARQQGAVLENCFSGRGLNVRSCMRRWPVAEKWAKTGRLKIWKLI